MKMMLQLLFIASLGTCIAAESIVYIRHVNNEGRVKRSIEEGKPSVLALEISGESSDPVKRLVLSANSRLPVTANLQVYDNEELNNRAQRSLEGVGLYHDKDNHAAMLVDFSERSLKVEGLYHDDDGEYHLEPVEDHHDLAIQRRSLGLSHPHTLRQIKDDDSSDDDVEDDDEPDDDEKNDDVLIVDDDSDDEDEDSEYDEDSEDEKTVEEDPGEETEDEIKKYCRLKRNGKKATKNWDDGSGNLDEMEYEIEYMQFLDHTLYDFWMKAFNNNSDEALHRIRLNYLNQMNSLDLPFSLLTKEKDGIAVRLIPMGVVVLTTEEKSVWTYPLTFFENGTRRIGLKKGHINLGAGTALGAFKDWLYSWTQETGNRMPDHAALRTRYTLLPAGVAGKGICVLSEKCTDSADGVKNCTYRYGGASANMAKRQMSLKITAHELGHNLGMGHASDKGIMGGGMKGGTKPSERLYYSCESVEEMKKHLVSERDKKGCLKESNCDERMTMNDNYLFPAEGFTYDDLCKWRFGNTSSFGQKAKKKCNRFLCRVPGKKRGQQRTGIDGLRCGDNDEKVCVLGFCVEEGSYQHDYMNYTCKFKPGNVTQEEMID